MAIEQHASLALHGRLVSASRLSKPDAQHRPRMEGARRLLPHAATASEAHSCHIALIIRFKNASEIWKDKNSAIMATK